MIDPKVVFMFMWPTAFRVLIQVHGKVGEMFRLIVALLALAQHADSQHCDADGVDCDEVPAVDTLSISPIPGSYVGTGADVLTICFFFFFSLLWSDIVSVW